MAGEKMSSEALWLFKQLNLHLELEGRFQPREKGLSLIEGAAEVRGAAGLGWLRSGGGRRQEIKPEGFPFGRRERCLSFEELIVFPANAARLLF